jgi:hypothetical protein
MAATFAMALAIVIAFRLGAGPGERVSGALRTTARWSFTLFRLATVGRALATLFGERFQALAAHARDRGLSYASLISSTWDSWFGSTTTLSCMARESHCRIRPSSSLSGSSGRARSRFCPSNPSRRNSMPAPAGSSEPSESSTSPWLSSSTFTKVRLRTDSRTSQAMPRS